MAQIIKNRKGREIISRDLIFDNEISDRARFVYCYMMAKPDDWDFLMQPMAEEIGYSIDTLRKYINELIQRGWLTKGEQQKNESNQFGAVSYIIHEERQCDSSDSEIFRHGESIAQESIDYIESREEEINNKQKKNNIKFDFLREIIGLGVERQIAEDYITVRKGKKLSQTQTAFNRIKNNIEILKETHGFTANDCIRIAVERSWGGIEVDFFCNIPTKQQPTLFKENNDGGWQ